MSSSAFRTLRGAPPFLALALLAGVGLAAPETRLTGVINIDPPHISTDKTVKYDFDVVYVRAPRKG
ncbi:MAG: hypothetical protein ACKODX_08675, partial [Gemmata sp.]